MSEARKVKCDCTIDSMLAAIKNRQPHWFYCQPWSDTTSWLWCDVHRIYVMIEHASRKAGVP